MDPESANSFEIVLSESHSRHLLGRWQEIDRMMTEVESVLSAASSNSVFPKYKAELSPVQIRVIRDYMASIRRELLQSARALGISLPPPQIGSLHAIRVDLTFAEIAADECTPEQLRGYGEVPSAAIPRLRGMVEQLRSSIGKLETFLSEGADLNDRFQRLDRTDDEINLLGRITEIIDRRGMVEFRPAITAILERYKTESYEIAVFGRVSSGKSSLLNHILEAEILPVGVTPVTAIPTRIIFGVEPAIEVAFGIGKRERLGIQRLAEFVTEQQNKNNDKEITRIVVEFPSRRLEKGIVFVDTPGLGSLATSGASETLAYLPRCDLGVLLVDSASTLTEEDVGTIRMLLEAGIPASILLSKVDLLKPAERDHTIGYIKQKIQERLGVILPVSAVSIVPHEAYLLESWFEIEIAPLYAQHKELARQSLRRKIGLLRQSVETALKSASGRNRKKDQPEPAATRGAADRLRVATGDFDEALRRSFEVLDRLRKAPDLTIAEVAREAADFIRNDGQREIKSERVRLIAQRIASEQTHDMPKILTKLALDSAGALKECARDLGIADTPDPVEFAASVQGMPLIDLGSLDTFLRAGVFARMSTGLAVRDFTAQLRAGIGQDLTRAFSVYSGILQRWLRATLKDLRERFDAYAETYRAKITHTDAPAGIDADATIEQDLIQLNGAASKSQTEVSVP